MPLTVNIEAGRATFTNDGIFQESASIVSQWWWSSCGMHGRIQRNFSVGLLLIFYYVDNKFTYMIVFGDLFIVAFGVWSPAGQIGQKWVPTHNFPNHSIPDIKGKPDPQEDLS